MSPLAAMFLVAAACGASADAITTHRIESPFQAGETLIRVLTPDSLDSNKQCPTVYVLPVEGKSGKRYGDGLAEVERLGLHNEYSAIFVAPTFSHLPWYADHPTDPAIRQESHLIHFVVPFVEKHYPASRLAANRLLLGFSKSGWGAWTILLRHNDEFGKAAAWDAPMMMDRPGKYGSGPIFGSEKNFEKYHVVRLLRERGEQLGQQPRLILTGKGNFEAEHVQVKQVLEELALPHIYHDGPTLKHDWHSGWVANAVKFLFEEPASNAAR